MKLTLGYSCLKVTVKANVCRIKQLGQKWKMAICRYSFT